MRIAIATLSGEINYGAFLQAAALAEMVKRLNHEATLIRYNRKPLQPWYRKYLAKSPGALAQKLRLFKFQQLGELAFRSSGVQFHPGTAKVFSRRSIGQVHEKGFDAYIAGSDQIWNPHIIHPQDRAFFQLSFPPDSTRRISYAASFGVASLSDDYSKTVKANLRRFHVLGVRERSGQELLNSLGLGGLTRLVLDPTLLYDQGNYGWITNRDCIEDDRNSYSLSYILNAANLEKLKFLQTEVCKEWKLSSIEVPTAASVVGKSPDKVYSPEEFVALYQNSSFVVTDSFHGVAFSITFNKPFIYLPCEGRLEYRNDRVFHLMELAALGQYKTSHQDYLNGCYSLPSVSDWNRTNELLAVARSESISFLRDSLSK